MCCDVHTSDHSEPAVCNGFKRRQSAKYSLPLHACLPDVVCTFLKTSRIEQGIIKQLKFEIKEQATGL